MGYIQTRPPVGAADIDDLIARLDSVKTSKIDGVVLSNLFRVCCECALKKSELIELSIEDVAKGGIVRDILRVGDSELRLSGQAKQVLQNHIDYLKKSGYRLYPTKPLFPTRKKTRYTEKTLGNHLKKAQNSNIQS
jgi:integrase